MKIASAARAQRRLYVGQSILPTGAGGASNDTFSSAAFFGAAFTLAMTDRRNRKIKSSEINISPSEPDHG